MKILCSSNYRRVTVDKLSQSLVDDCGWSVEQVRAIPFNGLQLASFNVWRTLIVEALVDSGEYTNAYNAEDYGTACAEICFGIRDPYDFD